MSGSENRRRGSARVVYVGIATNLGIAVCKYIVAGFAHSPAMWAEAYHSTADIGNEFLLLVGMRRSGRPADTLHPFGHGKVLYFYSLLVAVYIFAIGGGLSIYEGVFFLRHPHHSSHTVWSYAVLAAAGVFDFYSWRVSRKELISRKDPEETLWDEILGSKDPTVFTVFLEDSAGLIGVFLAFAGISLGHLFHNPYLDPAASIAVGLLLICISLVLGRESGALLVGERTNRVRLRRAREIIQSDPAVELVGDLLTMQLGPEQVLLNVDIRFRRGLSVPELESCIDRLENSVRSEDPTITRIFIEADALKSNGLAPSGKGMRT